MSRAPLVAGLVAGAVTFGIVLAASGGGDDPQPRASTTASADRGATLFAREGCGSCHALAAAGAKGGIGPSLDERLPGHSAQSLRAVITKPPPNSIMPEDFGERLSPDELDALVAWLVRQR